MIMANFSKFVPFMLLLCLIATSSAFGQTGFDDSQMRQSAAVRIKTTHGVDVDWKNTTLLELSDIEARLNTVSRIKQGHGLLFDWKTNSLLQLTDAEARLNAVKRIKENHGVEFDWQKTSLLQLTDTEARMNAARRIAGATNQPVDWSKHSLDELLRMESGLTQTNSNSDSRVLPFDVLFPIASQKAMGIQKLTDSEKRALHKHVESLLVAAAQAGATQQSQVQQSPQIPRSSATRTKVYAGVGGGHWIKKNIDSGTFMVLEDGSLWEIDRIDKIDAMLWLPISNITVMESSSGSLGYDYLLINTDDGEKAHAKYIGNQ